MGRTVPSMKPKQSSMVAPLLHVDCICVSTQGSRVHNCVIPPANSVPINVVNPDHDFVVDHAEFCNRSSNIEIMYQ